MCASSGCPSFFHPASLRGKEYCCEGPDELGKALLLDGTEQKVKKKKKKSQNLTGLARTCTLRKRSAVSDR